MLALQEFDAGNWTISTYRLGFQILKIHSNILHLEWSSSKKKAYQAKLGHESLLRSAKGHHSNTGLGPKCCLLQAQPIWPSRFETDYVGPLKKYNRNQDASAQIIYYFLNSTVELTAQISYMNHQRKLMIQLFCIKILEYLHICPLNMYKL